MIAFLSCSFMIMKICILLCFFCFTECGLKRTPATSLIGNEEFVDLKEYPWVVAIYQDNAHYCSGTIISPYHVVTGQCWVKYNYN